MASVVIARLNDARLVEAVDTQNVAKKQKVILNIEGVLEFATVERVEQKDTDSAIFVERIARQMRRIWLVKLRTRQKC